MNKDILLIFIIICITSIFSVSNAQQRFGAGIIAGVTASQIRGDDYAGYDKVGLTAGLRSTIYLKENMELGIEILYSQRGSINEFDKSEKINLTYIEVPVIFNIKDWKKEDKDFYHMHFSGGLSYGRLFGGKDDLFNPNSDGSIDHFNQDDLSFLLGATYYINKHFGAGFRYTRSLTLLNKTDITKDLIVHFLTFRTLYMF